MSPPDPANPGGQRPAPDLPTILSLGLLVVVALLLVLPLLGLGRPPVWILAGLLLVRLGIQFWRARRIAAGGSGRASSGWLLDVVLIGLLLYEGWGKS